MSFGPKVAAPFVFFFAETKCHRQNWHKADVFAESCGQTNPIFSSLLQPPIINCLVSMTTREMAGTGQVGNVADFFLLSTPYCPLI